MTDKKILVVDDESFIRELFEYFLGKAGYSIYTAATVEEALEILSLQAFPVMFIDLGLNARGIDGFELCEKIRKENPKAVIYALSGYINLFDPQEFREAGFDACFKKPPNIQAIQQAVKEAFAKMGRQHAIKRILIIDDDDQFRMMLHSMLELEGYTVSEASGAEEGILRQSEQPADLIIADVIMPGKDGVDAMLDIKEAFPEANFIVMTGKTGYRPDAKLDIAKTFGAKILRKPFQRKEILDVIQQL